MRAALSRLPGWVTALGIVLLLGELGGGIALLAVGHGGTGHPYAARGRPHATGSPAVTASPAVTGSPGATQTAVLRVDGGYAGCDPISRCGDEALRYQVLYVTPAGHYEWSYPRSVPFIKEVRVPAGEFVKFNAYPGTQARATCTITVGGVILSQITTRTLGGIAACRSVIPPVNGPAVGSGGGTRTVVLQVDNAYSGAATYTTPAGTGQLDMPPGTPPLGSHSDRVRVVTKTVAVPAGGIVTVHTVSGYGGFYSPACSITMNGRVLSQATADAVWSSGTCRARIP